MVEPADMVKPVDLAALVRDAYERKRTSLGLRGSFDQPLPEDVEAKHNGSMPFVTFETQHGTFRFTGKDPEWKSINFDNLNPYKLHFWPKDELTEITVDSEVYLGQRNIGFELGSRGTQNLVETRTRYSPTGTMMWLAICPSSAAVFYDIDGKTAHRRWTNPCIKNPKAGQGNITQQQITEHLAKLGCVVPEDVDLDELAAGKVTVAVGSEKALIVYPVPAVPACIAPQAYVEQLLQPLLASVNA